MDRFGIEYGYKWIGKNLPERIGQRCQVVRLFPVYVLAKFKDGVQVKAHCSSVRRVSDPGLMVVGGTP